MSAYVVDNQTISKILVGVRFLNNGVNNSWLVSQLTNGRLTNPFQHVDWDNNEDLQSIGKKNV